MRKQSDQMEFRVERVHFFRQFHTIFHWENSRHELKTGSWRHVLLFYIALPLTKGVTSQPKCTRFIQDAAFCLTQRLIYTHLAFLNSSEPPNIEPRDGPTHSVLGPPTSINNQDHSPMKHPQANLIYTLPQLRLSCWIALAVSNWHKQDNY